MTLLPCQSECNEESRYFADAVGQGVGGAPNVIALHPVIS